MIGLVTRLATGAIPGSTCAGVTLVDSRGKRTTAASDPLVEQADALQHRAQDPGRTAPATFSTTRAA